jgi:hypothetical protein
MRPAWAREQHLTSKTKETMENVKGHISQVKELPKLKQYKPPQLKKCGSRLYTKV